MSRESISWWVSIAGKPAGPFTAAEIHSQLKAGEITAGTFACRVGDEQWRRLAECPEFAESDSTSQWQPPPPPPDGTQETKPPWDPLAIAWLGLLFTPAWSGIMAVFNARRLRLSQPLWRPLAIGVGSTVAALLYGCAGFDLGIVIEELTFTVAPLVALWYVDLEAQAPAYSNNRERTQDHWIAPVLAGSPLALLTLVGWWLTLFGPLEPLDVVRRFMESETPEAAREFVSTNLYPMVDDLKQAKQLDPDLASGDEGGDVEYLNEYYAEDDDNQYYVEFRWYIRLQSGDMGGTIEGYFHLRWIDGAWKIDDWVATSFDGEKPAAGPVSFSLIASELLKEARRKSAHEPKANSSNSLTSWYEKLPTSTKRWFGLLAMIAIFAALRALFNIKIPR